MTEAQIHLAGMGELRAYQPRIYSQAQLDAVDSFGTLLTIGGPINALRITYKPDINPDIALAVETWGPDMVKETVLAEYGVSPKSALDKATEAAIAEIRRQCEDEHGGWLNPLDSLGLVQIDGDIDIRALVKAILMASAPTLLIEENTNG